MNLTQVAQAVGHTVPTSILAAPKPEAIVFTAEEALRGRATRGNTIHYCCYGMYCDAGHSRDCQIAPGVGGDDAAA